MAKWKKIVCLILTLLIILPVFSGCAAFGRGTVTLRIMNWADYMDNSLLRQFEDEYTYQGKRIKILYETVDKPETMAVKIERGKEKWDLMCPSESVLERLMKQGLLNTIDTSPENMPNYNTYVSEYVKEQSNAVENSAKEAIKKSGDKAFDDFDYDADYSVAYMWGNFGILYNVDAMANDMDLLDSWAALWNKDKFKGKMMMKDGPRETFSIGIIYVYREPLMKLYKIYEEKGTEEALKNYTDFLADAFKISGETGKTYNIDGKTYEILRGEALIAKVEEALVDQKINAGTAYEVDDGKETILRDEGYVLDMAWNGDGVWALAEKEAKNIKTNVGYTIPKEGSNFWVDSWVIPKYARNNKVAEMFIDFLCKPETAMKNMEFIGYTSAIGGQDVLNWAVLYGENYDSPFDASDFFGDIPDFVLQDENGNDVYKNSVGNAAFTKLAYKMNGKLYYRETDEEVKNPGDFSEFLVDVDNVFINSIQYPSADELSRCGVMLGYSDYSDEILEMWTRVKGAAIPIYVIVGLSLVLVLAVTLGTLFYVKNRKHNKTINATVRKKH